MAALLGMLLCALASTTAASMPPMTPMSPTAARKANQYIFSQRRNNKQGDTRRLDASLEQRCTAMLRHERGTRVGLINLVEPYSGSTALLSLLRQSTVLAAICSGGSWQCEHSQAAAKLVVAKRPGALLNVPVNMIELLSPSLTDRLNRTGVIAPYRGNLEPPPCGLCANFTELHAFFKKSEGTQQSLVGTECSDAIAEALLSALKWEGQRLVCGERTPRVGGPAVRARCGVRTPRPPGPLPGDAELKVHRPVGCDAAGPARDRRLLH